MIGIICALFAEAKGTILRLGLKSVGGGFYESERYALRVLDECGTIAAAVGTAQLCERYKVTKIFNFGTAGTNDPTIAVGDVVSPVYAVLADYDLSNVDEINRGELPNARNNYCFLQAVSGYRTVTLKTADRFGGETLSTQIEDMELAAICEAAYYLGAEVYSLKGISNGKEGGGKEYAANKMSIIDKLTDAAVTAIEEL